MGQTLTEPSTEKETSIFENDLFLVGVSSMQGWRTEMEDAHSVQLPLSTEDKDSAYFGVFDGHGGAQFAAYCGEHLHKEIMSDVSFSEGNYECALKCAFLTLDRNLQEDASLGFQYEPGGTTAVVVLVKDKQIFCANSGDSRAITSVRGQVQELSHDHKPTHPAEESRIYRAGGWVEFQRVNGNLSLSRAIGDFNYKDRKDLPQEEQIITANPEIIVEDVTPEHEFIVLACDGVWDVMSNQEVVDFVRKRVAEHMKPHLICEALLDHCLAPDCRMGGLGCDNMTVIIACCLHDGEPYSKLARKCSEQVERRQTDSERDVFSEGKELPNGNISEERTSRSTYLQSDTLPGFGTSKLKETLCEVNTDPVFSRQNICISENVQPTSSVHYDVETDTRIETTV